jgi:predicted Zn-ribbon and HTH transcriptional regulator
MPTANQQLIEMVLIASAAVSAIVVLFGLYRLIRSVFAKGMQRKLSQWREDDEADRCRQCGYDMRNLDMPRCPECGCARGFDKTFEQLGVDERQVQQHVAHRRRVLETMDKMELLNPHAADDEDDR